MIIDKNKDFMVKNLILEIFEKHKLDIFDFVLESIPVTKVKNLSQKYPKHIIINYIDFFLKNYSSPEYVLRVFQKYKINHHQLSEIELELIEKFIIISLKDLFEANWNANLEAELKSMFLVYKKVCA